MEQSVISNAEALERRNELIKRYKFIFEATKHDIYEWVKGAFTDSELRALREYINDYIRLVMETDKNIFNEFEKFLTWHIVEEQLFKACYENARAALKKDEEDAKEIAKHYESIIDRYNKLIEEKDKMINACIENGLTDLGVKFAQSALEVERTIGIDTKKTN